MPSSHSVNDKSVSMLLVEDDEIDALGVKKALTRLRVANPLVHVRNGREALAVLREGKLSQPYLVLLDLNMPIMGGLEMLEELRQDASISSSVVFVLTTSESDEDITAAYKEHIAGYIVKSRLDKDFNGLFSLLDHYWRVIELPAPVEI